MEKYLDKTIEWSVLAVVLLPLFFMPFFLWDFYELAKATLLHFITLVILGAWLLKILYTKRLKFRPTSLELPLLIFVLVITISTILSANPSLSVVGAFKRHEGLATWFSYILLYFAAANFFLYQKQVQRFLQALLFFSIPVCLYGIFQHFGWDFFRFAERVDITRSFSTLGNPVFLGAYLTLIIPLALVLLLRESTTGKKIFLGMVSTLALICLVYTFGRAAWLGTLSALIFLTIFIPKESLKKRWKTIVPLATSVVIILIMSIIIPSPNPSLKLVTRRAQSVATVGEGTVATRLEMWKRTLLMIAARPFLGWGLEKFEYAFPKYRSLKSVRLEGEKPIPDRPHNEMLYLASSLGLVGLLVYLWVFFTFFGKGWRLLKEATSHSKILFLGLMGAVFGYFFQAQFSFSIVGVTPLAWILMGFTMTTITGNQIKKENPFFVFKLNFLNLNFLRIILAGIILILFIFLGSFTFRFFLADHYYQLSLNYPPQLKKIENLDRALALNPYQNLYRLELGKAYSQWGRDSRDKSLLNQAIAVYRKGLQLNPKDEEIYFNLGNVYGYLGQGDDSSLLDSAAKAYQKAVEIDPLFSKAHGGLGIIYFEKRNFRKGIKHFQEAIRIDPNNHGLRYNIGFAYEQMGRREEAKQSYRAALKLKASFKAAREALKRLERETK